MSAQEYQKFIRQRSGLPSATGPPSAKKPKYHNVKIYIYEDGFVANQKVTGHGKLLRKYDSTKEYRRSEELRLLERAHKISALSAHPLPTVMERSIAQSPTEPISPMSRMAVW